MDESGKYDDPNNCTVSVCGVVSSLEKWTAFEKAWKNVLDHYKISWFHMREFAHFKGEFSGWEDYKRREFINALVDVMHKDVIGCIAATMSKYHFDGLTAQQRLAIGNDPYYLCFLACIIRSAETVLHLASEETVEVIFADNPNFKGKAGEFWQRVKGQDSPESIRKRLGNITLDAEPRDVLPLQAADLVAYEINHHLTEIYKEKRWPEGRWPFNQLKGKMLFIEVFDKKTLHERFGF